MKVSKVVDLTIILGLTLAMSAPTWAQGQSPKAGAEQAQKAATVFKEIMDTPDKGVPKSLLEKARCVAVFPSVIKGGFIFGARGGRGVAICRTASGWSAPAYFSMKGGSFGLQIGAQATDFVLLFMNDNAMQSLLKSKFTLGGDASVAAGPVGRETGAETDARLNAQVLSYSRSKGAFAGLELKGTAITPDKSDMESAYGKGKTAQQVLMMPEDKAPKEVQVFPEMVANYSGGKASN